MRKTNFEHAMQYLNSAAEALIFEGGLQERLERAKRCLATYIPSEDCFGRSVMELKKRLSGDTSGLADASSIAAELFRLHSMAIASSRSWCIYDEEEEYLRQLKPYCDTSGGSIESAPAFAARIRNNLLPNFPEEVLIEWFYRHYGYLGKYAFLGYEKFRFQRDTWKLENIPTVEDAVFGDCNFRSIDDNSYNWLAEYMLKNHTWNTPLILLDNRDGYSGGNSLKSPFHLLEGHRRLFYLNELRAKGIAKSTHEVWVVSLNAVTDDVSK